MNLYSEIGSLQIESQISTKKMKEGTATDVDKAA